MNPAAGDPLAAAGGQSLTGKGRTRLDALPRNCRIRMTITLGNDAAPCGLRFRDAENAPGLELRLDAAANTIQLGSNKKRYESLAGNTHRIEIFLQEEIIDVCLNDLETLVVSEPPALRKRINAVERKRKRPNARPRSAAAVAIRRCFATQ